MIRSYLFKFFICMIIACSLDIIIAIVFSITPFLAFFIGGGLGIIATIVAMTWDEYAS